VGGVVSVVALILAILVYIRGRRRRRDAALDSSADESTKSTDAVKTIDGPDGTSALEPGQKAELAAIPAALTDAASMGKQELPGESVIVPPRFPPPGPQAFELDASPLVPELEGKQNTPESPARQQLVSVPDASSAPGGIGPRFSRH
jgi:hypothetical protein